MPKQSDLLRSITSGYTLFFATNVTALFLTPYILKFTGKDEYGFYLLCVELFTWIGFLEFGTAKALGPSVSKELAKENDKEIIYLFNSSFWFQLGVAILAIPLYYFIIEFSGAEKSGLVNYKWLIGLFSIAAFIQTLGNQFSEMIIATKKIHLDNRIQLIILILRIGLILASVPFFGIEAVFYTYLGVELVQITRKFWRVKVLYPNLKLSVSLFSKERFQSLFANGIYFTLSSIATILILRLDQFIIGREYDMETITKLYVSTRLFQLAEKALGVFFNNFRPHISQIYARKDYKVLLSLYNELSLLALCTACLVYGVIVLINSVFVDFWVGEDFLLTQNIISLFGLIGLINAFSLPSKTILISTLRFIRHLTIARILHALLRIALLFAMIGYLGLEAIPLSNIMLMIPLVIIYPLMLNDKLFKGFKQSLKPKASYYLALVPILWLTILCFTDYILQGIVLVFIGMSVMFYFLKNYRKLTVTNILRSK